MISITNKESNYLARIMKIEELQEIEGARTLQKAIIDFQEVATSKDVKLGDVVVYFPAGSQIDAGYLSYTNSFANKELNADTSLSGYFNKKGVVKAINLMKGAIKSCGYIVPAVEYFNYYDIPQVLDNRIFPIEFDTIKDSIVVKKYEPPAAQEGTPGSKKSKKGLNLRDLIKEDQFRFHTQTEHLSRNVHLIDLEGDIVVTRKRHGSSMILSNVLINRKLPWYKWIGMKLGMNIESTEYGYVWSSGKPKGKKPKGIESPSRQWKTPNPSFYTEDIWKKAYNLHKDKLFPGLSVYGEITGEGIQGGGYTYGKDFAVHVYRMTYTDPDGNVHEVKWDLLKDFCDKKGFDYVEEYYNGPVSELASDHNELLELLKDKYLDKSYPDCKVDEGICVRQNDRILKFKSPNFLIHESGKIDG